MKTSPKMIGIVLAAVLAAESASADAENVIPRLSSGNSSSSLRITAPAEVNQLITQMTPFGIPEGIHITGVSLIGRCTSAGLYSAGRKNSLFQGTGAVFTTAENAGTAGADSKIPFSKCVPDSLRQPGDRDADSEISRCMKNGDQYLSLDASGIVIDFISDRSIDEVTFNYLFGSEEYAAGAGPLLYDIFAVFLDGRSIAKDPFGSAVTPQSQSFAPYKQENAEQASSIQYPAGTQLLNASASISEGRHTLKFVIADVGDDRFDSGAFISGLTFLSHSASGSKLCLK